MKNNATLFAVIAIALSVFALVHNGAGPSAPSRTETVAERVLKTGTLRCGYSTWDPMMIKDPKTGALSGLSYDIISEMGKRLNLKIDWAEEVSFDVALQGLTSNRYDTFCVPLFANSNRARESSFTVPFAYASVYLVVRADEKRFTGDVAQLNNPKYRMATLDGDISALFGDKTLPLVTKDPIAQIQGYSFVFKDVEAGKADFTIADPKTLANYNRENNNTLKIIGAPVITNAIAYPLVHDERLKGMFDITLREMLLDGSLAELFHKYDVDAAYKLPIQPFVN